MDANLQDLDSIAVCRSLRQHLRRLVNANHPAVLAT